MSPSCQRAYRQAGIQAYRHSGIGTDIQACNARRHHRRSHLEVLRNLAFIQVKRSDDQGARDLTAGNTTAAVCVPMLLLLLLLVVVVVVVVVVLLLLLPPSPPGTKKLHAAPTTHNGQLETSNCAGFGLASFGARKLMHRIF